MKIAYYPLQPHSLAFGGFEIQMIQAYEALTNIGVDVVKLNPWTKNIKFDIIHLWGLSSSNLHLIEWAKKNKIKVVLSVLAPYGGRLRGCINKIRRLTNCEIGRLQYIINIVDSITVVNEGQKDSLENFFCLMESKIHIVPNMIDPTYLENNVLVKKEERKGVICVGNISPRKRQLNLVQACIDSQIPLDIIGGVEPGCDDYLEKIKSLECKSNKLIKLRGWLPQGSVNLIQAYCKAEIFALISDSETQPISALEALNFNCKLVLSDKSWANIYPFVNHVKVNPLSIKDISRGLLEATKNDFVNDSLNIQKEYSPEVVANKYFQIYKKIFNNQ